MKRGEDCAGAGREGGCAQAFRQGGTGRALGAVGSGSPARRETLVTGGVTVPPPARSRVGAGGEPGVPAWLRRAPSLPL